MSAHWITNAVIYHIYVRSFQDSNSDGVGDLKGLINRLDYLNDGTDNSLGINCIWLSPIYPSPMADFGYDVADYTGIDPLFGSLDDFDEFLAKAHQKHIKVLMDYIPNHTSAAHPWFMESRNSKDNPKRDWYIWQDAKKDGSPPNNWVSAFGGSAWQWDDKTQQYYYHSFDPLQPDLNWRNPEVVKAMQDALRFWLDKGVDGFRIDAYDFLFKHTDFADEPPNPTFILGQHGQHDSLVHLYSFGQPENLTMLKEIADILHGYQHKFMVTEVYSTVERLIEMYKHIGHNWYAPFNFGLIVLPWTATAHKEYIDKFDDLVGHDFIPTHVLGNHDQHRVASRVGREQARIGAMLLMTLRGVPFIYYGDELGMLDGEIPRDKIQDPFELRSPGLGLGRDPERTPMQWSSQPGAGFTDVEPWLPLAEKYQEFNVEVESKDEKSFLALYKKLIKLKKTEPALYEGKYRSVTTENPNIFMYLRETDKEAIAVILNYSNEDQIVNLELPNSKVLADTLNEKNHAKLNSEDLAHLHLLPDQGLLLKLEDTSHYA